MIWKSSILTKTWPTPLLTRLVLAMMNKTHAQFVWIVTDWTHKWDLLHTKKTRNRERGRVVFHEADGKPSSTHEQNTPLTHHTHTPTPNTVDVLVVWLDCFPYSSQEASVRWHVMLLICATSTWWIHKPIPTCWIVSHLPFHSFVPLVHQCWIGWYPLCFFLSHSFPISLHCIHPLSLILSSRNNNSNGMEFFSQICPVILRHVVVLQVHFN